MSPKNWLTVAAIIGCGSTAAMADGSIEIDLGGNLFSGYEISSIGDYYAGEAHAGAKIISIDWSGLELVTFNNVGVPYYGSEALIGIEGEDEFGSDSTFWFFPLPDANYQGTPDNPIVQDDPMSMNVESFGLHLDPMGGIGALLTAAWNDGSGLDAGQWINGVVTIHYEKIPAPGALALLALAGVAGSRGRRRH